MIKVYSDNLSEKELSKLISILANRYGQTLKYFNRCARRMGRYAKKNKPLGQWPAHIRSKYNFVTQAHTAVLEGKAYTT